MVKLQKKDDRDIIARMPLAAEEGELVAWKDDGEPVIDLVIEPIEVAERPVSPREEGKHPKQITDLIDAAIRNEIEMPYHPPPSDASPTATDSSSCAPPRNSPGHAAKTYTQQRQQANRKTRPTSRPAASSDRDETAYREVH